MIGYLKRISGTLAMLTEEARLAAVPLPRLILDILVFCTRTGLGPRYYVVAGMARKGFPEKSKWQHISARSYDSALSVLNPMSYRKLTQNKMAEKALYQLLNIPTAKLLGYYHSHGGIDAAGLPLRKVEQLNLLLASLEGQKVCVKPVEGWGGAGVIVGQVMADADGPWLYPSSSGRRLSAAQLVSSCETRMSAAEFVIEAFLSQSSEFSAFNPSSLNTLRLWVLEHTSGKPQVIGAYLRIGRANSAIDNASAGGIMCPVDLSNGALLPGLTKHTPHRDDILCHPDHGAPLAGHRLSTWSEIVEFSCEVVTRLPCTRFAGLDVTMTDLGPILVETNVAPDKDGAAHANIPSIMLQKAAKSYYV